MGHEKMSVIEDLLHILVAASKVQIVLNDFKPANIIRVFDSKKRVMFAGLKSFRTVLALLAATRMLRRPPMTNIFSVSSNAKAAKL